MKRVICFGEALIDFLNIGQHIDGNLVLNEFRQYPGGAPANVAVAVAKLGGRALFAGQVGSDSFGDFLALSLNKYQVNIEYLVKHATAKTALAFVTLDEDGERSFTFHRTNSADVLFTKEQVCKSWFNPQTIFHFCSNTLTSQSIAEATRYAVSQAHENNSLISFDVNLRHNLWSSEKVDAALVSELVLQADVLKFSKEELDFLCKATNAESHETYLSLCLAHQASLIFVTDGGKDINYYTTSSSGKISPPEVSVVDTTAAGDGFVGGLLFSLSQVTLTEIISQPEKLTKLVCFSVACGAFVVSQAGAFPAMPNLEQTVELFEKTLIKNSDISLSLQ